MYKARLVEIIDCCPWGSWMILKASHISAAVVHIKTCMYYLLIMNHGSDQVLWNCVLIFPYSHGAGFAWLWHNAKRDHICLFPFQDGCHTSLPHQPIAIAQLLDFQRWGQHPQMVIGLRGYGLGQLIGHGRHIRSRGGCRELDIWW